MSDIVARAGVAQGTFYNYYRSNDEIYIEALLAAAEERLRKLDELAARSDLTAAQKLKMIEKIELERVFAGPP